MLLMVNYTFVLYVFSIFKHSVLDQNPYQTVYIHRIIVYFPIGYYFTYEQRILGQDTTVPRLLHVSIVR